MPVTRTVPQPPPAGVPMVDAEGRLTPQWQQWFVELIAFLREVKDEVP